MYIYNYSDFLLEYSKSDPIPELTWNKKGKTAIFIFGAPGVGKTTFTKEFILPKLKNYKIFDPDEVMKKIQKATEKKYKNISKIKRNRKRKTEKQKEEKILAIKDTLATINAEYNISIYLTDQEIEDIIDNNLYYSGGYNLLEKQFLLYLKHSNADAIYDTTGNDFERIKNYSELAKKHGYSVLFIKVKSSVKTAFYSNIDRKDRTVQPDYQLDSIKKGDALEQEYKTLNPDAYYIYNRENKKIENI